MKFILTESQYKKVISENDEDVSDILSDLSGLLKMSHGNEQDYGIEGNRFKWFRRRLNVFEIYLSKVIHSAKTGEYDWLVDHSKYLFTRTVLIYSLLDFFYYDLGEEYEVEDFTKNGGMEGWLFLLMDMYGHYVSKVYDEIKNPPPSM